MQLRTRLALAAMPLLFALTPAAHAAAGDPRVAIETSMGVITVELAPERAPITVKNFLAYVEKGHYDGTIFHRVIPGFMIQGGGFTADMQEKQTMAPIPLEARGGLPNNRYTIAMARTSYPHSATSQFFINVADNDFLNADRAQDGNGYAVFGRVVDGTDVVDKIAAVKTGVRGYMRDVPVETVTIKNVRIVK